MISLRYVKLFFMALKKSMFVRDLGEVNQMKDLQCLI